MPSTRPNIKEAITKRLKNGASQVSSPIEKICMEAISSVLEAWGLGSGFWILGFQQLDSQFLNLDLGFWVSGF
jgi:hypothetical protein